MGRYRQPDRGETVPGKGNNALFPGGSAFGGTLLSSFGALTLVSLTGCALGFTPPSTELVKTCVLPADQKNTLAAHWSTLPVPIAFHQGDFSASEIAAMTAGADTWNTFYSATLKIPKVIDYGGASVRLSTQPVPTDACSMGLTQGGVYTGQVVLYRQNVWPHPTGATTVMALTNYCSRPASAGSPLPVNYMAYLEVNYQGFFTGGPKQPDLQTIVGHEFGHLLGLLHSCVPGSTTAGIPDCAKAGLSADYTEALMYPTFGFRADLTGEQKRDLKSNDQGRANCLYKAVGS